jgi:hypothetical protein
VGKFIKEFDALRRAGIDEAHIVTDHASGTREDRPGPTRSRNC